MVWWLGGVKLRPGVHVCGGVLFAHPNAWVQRGAFIGPRSLIVPTADAPVRIGREVALGPDVRVLTVTHPIGTHDRRAADPAYSLPVEIEDGAWIGAGAMLLPGVTVGAGAAVAAGAVVVDDVAPDTLVAGVPAKQVRELDT